MEEATFGLAWNSFPNHIACSLSDLFKTNTFSDVTLVSEDDWQVKAHKFVLSACSPVLRKILLNNLHPHPVIFLRGVKKQALESFL